MHTLTAKFDRFLDGQQRQSILWYSLKMAGIGMALRLPFVMLYFWWASTSGTTIAQPTGQETIGVFDVLVMAPLIETFIFQMILVEAVALFRGGLCLQVLIPAVVFALLHGMSGQGGFFPVAAVFGSSMAFAVSYVAWRRRSLGEAFGVTALVHMWSNAISLVVTLL